MKKIIISLGLLIMVNFVSAQIKTNVQILPMSAPPGGGCTYCYQWNIDEDNDGFGDPSDFVLADTKPTRYVSNQSDCNDSDATINPNTIWYRDADGDGYGVSSPTIKQCTQPTGYVRNATDLNDGNVNITNITPSTFYRDIDNDGFGSASSGTVNYSNKPAGYVTNNSDCNDNDVSVNPNTIWYRDADGDGFGTGSTTTTSCTQPSGYVRNNSDCNDGDVTLNPNTIWYRDADGDGFGTTNTTTTGCTQPVGYVINNADCNDGNSSINPNIVWYRDLDGDGYGSNSTTKSCTQPSGFVSNNSDCDDNHAEINPDTIWYRDTDGDGFGHGPTITACLQPVGYAINNLDCIDGDATINPNTIWYRDADGDGYGATTPAITQCAQPAGYVQNSNDYDDSTVNITNIAPQRFYQDLDGDYYGNPNISVFYSIKPVGYGLLSMDCNDNDPTINPNTVWYRDADFDGYGNPNVSTTSCTQPNGYVRNNTDCNDADVTLNPNTVWYLDADADGYGNSGITSASCTQPQGYVRNSNDYNDSSVNITNVQPQIFYQDADSDSFGNPGVSVYYSEKPGGYVINNSDCDDNNASLNPNTKWYADTDGDGLGDPSIFVQQCTAPEGNYVNNNSDNCPLIRGTGTDCASVKAPSLDQNYIITTTYKQPTTTIFVNPDPSKAKVGITYFDGLGKPVQQIANQQSASGKDIITNIEYDGFGRQTKDYLPFASTATNMVYDANALTNTLSYYKKTIYDNADNPFSEKKLESSPLNRVLKQAAPGADWAMGAGHEIKLAYQTNTGTEVKLYVATTIWNSGLGIYDISFSDGGNYGVSQLDKTITYDENSATSPTDEKLGSTVEFKNKEGQIVLKRTYESGVKHDTYYTYDQYGNLTFVIPPLVDATTTITQTLLDDLCYQYKYDSRNRLVEKKLPGKQWEFIVYDKLDRVVATGPALSPFTNLSGNGWLITKYDAFNRPILTAWQPATVSSSTRATNQTNQNNATTISETKNNTAVDNTVNGVYFRYSNTVVPTAGFHILTINYYDDYKFKEATWTMPTSVLSQAVYYNNTNKPKGLPTGSWTRVLAASNTYYNERNYLLYDNKARVIKNYTYLYNVLGGYNSTYTKYDFAGKVLYTENYHKRQSTSTELKTTDFFTYTDQDRLLTHTQQINSNPIQLLVKNDYDELGKLIAKRVGGTDISGASSLQKVDYDYNIRGWMTGINKVATLQQGSEPTDLFGFKINYNTLDGDTNVSQKLYNGNIAETSWSSSPVVRTYGYKYDKLNRLTDATYQKEGITTNMFDENLTYDKNGNIQALNRNGDNDAQMGAMPIDKLTYVYASNSNKLLSVTDTPASAISGFKDGNPSGVDYEYDANGNMTIDRNKGITTAITYNHLNLPTKITFGTAGNITYIYNALGQKVQKVVNATGVSAVITDYLGSYQYQNAVLQFFPTAEGYVSATGSSYKYVYNYTDHLGNIRLSYAKNPTTNVLEILEENNYYPFGLKHTGYNNNPATNYKYKYNGKELQDELGLNMTAMDYRQYDNTLGRFNTIDVMSEKFPSLTPYSFSADNPILLNDPSGKDWSITITEDKKGKYHIQITVNAAIINSSGKNINMNNYIKNQTAQFNRIFSMNRSGFDVKANIIMREVKSESDVTESEHLISIQDSNNMNGELGTSHLGGLEVNINSDIINEDGTSTNNKTFSHEIGHTGGLEHPWEIGSSNTIGKNYLFGQAFGWDKVPKYNQNMVDLRTNFMSYPQKYTGAASKEEQISIYNKVVQNPGPATRGQIAAIMRYYSNGYLNNNDK